MANIIKMAVVLLILLIITLAMVFGSMITHRRVCRLDNNEFNLYVQNNFNYNMSREVYCVMLPWYMT